MDLDARAQASGLRTRRWADSEPSIRFRASTRRTRLGQRGLASRVLPVNESRAGSDFPIQPYRQPLGEGGNLPSGGDSVCAAATTSLRSLVPISPR